MTLLHIAAIYDSLECYVLLLEQDVFTTRSQSAGSYYPLHYACFYAAYEVAMYTLSIDPSIVLSEPDGANHQYLYLTVIGGDPQILKRFFDLKVNRESNKSRMNEVFSKCISCRSVDCLKILLENDKKNYDQYGDTTMQMKAIINNMPEALRLLVHSSEDIKFINSQGESVFSLACFYGINFKNSILDFLKISNYMCIEPPITCHCKGVCHWICQLCDLDVARAMLQTKGVIINRLDKNGHPGIFHLIDKPKNTKDENKKTIMLIQMLLDKGFSLNVRAPPDPETGKYHTESVLEKFTMSISPNLEIIKFLINNLADINAKRKDQKQTLYEWVMHGRNKRLQELFMNQKNALEKK